MVRVRVASCLVCWLVSRVIEYHQHLAAKHHASSLSSFLSENSLYFSVNKIISFQKLIGNLNKMIVANLGRHHHRSLNSHFKNCWEYLYLFEVITYYFIPSILLKLVAYIFKLILLMFLYSLNSTTIFCHLSYKWEDDASLIRLFFFLCFENMSYERGRKVSPCSLRPPTVVDDARGLDINIVAWPEQSKQDSVLQFC